MLLKLLFLFFTIFFVLSSNFTLSLIFELFSNPLVAVLIIIINPIVFESIGYINDTGLSKLFNQIKRFPPRDNTKKYHLQQNWVMANSIITLTIITAVIPIVVKVFEKSFDSYIAKVIIILCVVGFISSIMALEHLLVLIGIEQRGLSKYIKFLAKKAAWFHVIALDTVYSIFLLVIYSISPIWWGYLVGVILLWIFGWGIGIKKP